MWKLVEHSISYYFRMCFFLLFFLGASCKFLTFFFFTVLFPFTVELLLVIFSLILLRTTVPMISPHWTKENNHFRIGLLKFKSSTCFLARFNSSGLSAFLKNTFFLFSGNLEYVLIHYPDQFHVDFFFNFSASKLFNAVIMFAVAYHLINPLTDGISIFNDTSLSYPPKSAAKINKNANQCSP